MDLECVLCCLCWSGMARRESDKIDIPGSGQLEHVIMAGRSIDVSNSARRLPIFTRELGESMNLYESTLSLRIVRNAHHSESRVHWTIQIAMIADRFIQLRHLNPKDQVDVDAFHDKDLNRRYRMAPADGICVSCCLPSHYP